MANIDALLQISLDWVILFFSFFARRPMRNTRMRLLWWRASARMPLEADRAWSLLPVQAPNPL